MSYSIRTWLPLWMLAGILLWASAACGNDAQSAPPDDPEVSGPPALEVAVDGERAPLGIGRHRWSIGNGSEVSDDETALVTSPRVLTIDSSDELVIEGLGNDHPTTVVAELWTRPADSASGGASRLLWQRSGDSIDVVAALDGGSLSVAPEAEPGQYLLQLTIRYEDGAAEYGLQLDVR